MSYIVTVRRSNRAIAVDEIEALARLDGDIQTAVPPNAVAGELFVVLRPQGGRAEETLLLSAGELTSTTTPSDSALVKMQLIAKSLDARLVGEEGEDLTETDLKPGKVSTSAALGCWAIVSLVLGALVWWWLK